MRFGSVDMFTEFDDWGYRMGRPLANEGFLKALLTHGSYDTYEFFCSDVYHMDKFSEKIRTMIEDPHLLSRVQTSLQIALSESIKSQTYNIFHLGDFTYFMPYLIDIRNRYSRNPFPVTGVTHSLDSVHMNLRYIELTIAGLAPFDGIICSSHCAKDSVRKGLTRVSELLAKRTDKVFNIDARMEKIPLGIDDVFFDENDKNSARAYFSIPENMTVALSVGRLSLRKKNDWSPFLELLARMYSKGGLDNLLFLIAGGAAETDINLLESLISRLSLKNRVLLFPNFDPEIKTKLYKTADFYISIVDNFQETFGINIIEAMASGLPIIASNFSGYRELVRDGEDGFLIPTLWLNELPEFLKETLGILDPSVSKLYLSQTISTDLDELQNAINKLYNDEKLRTVMGQAAAERAQSYRWKNIIRQYEAFWSDLANEAKKECYINSKAGSDILVGDFQNTFSHYPSDIISDNDALSLTEVGRSVQKDTFSLVKYDDMAAILFPELERLILDTLSESDQSIGSLKSAASDRLQATEGQTCFHLQWLLKHGAITLKSHSDKVK